VPKLYIHFEEVFSRAHGNFVEQNKVLEYSGININNCVIINAYYNYIVNLMHSIIITVYFYLRPPRGMR
jgi:hypothetical protein